MQKYKVVLNEDSNNYVIWIEAESLEKADEIANEIMEGKIDKYDIK